MAASLRPVPPQSAPRTSDVLQQIMAITDQSLDEAQARYGVQARRERAEAG